MAKTSPETSQAAVAAHGQTLPTLAEHLAAAFAAIGVERLFGVPGGGSSLDVIAAAGRHGIPFLLAHGETAAAIMAATTGELTGTPGVVLTTIGPGVASVANGVAYAFLDRAPLIVVTDAIEADERRWVSHQALDQRALLAPVTKARWRPEDGAEALARTLALTREPPAGPVHLEFGPGQAQAPLPAGRDPGAPSPSRPPAEVPDDVAEARAMLGRARRPVVIAGLETRQAATVAALRALIAELKCPAFTTYKAKGVVADDDSALVGLFTGAVAEAPCLEQADLMLLAGLDPVELLPRPWRYTAPILELSAAPGRLPYRAPDLSLVGPLAPAIEALRGAAAGGGWPAAEIAGFRQDLSARLDMAATDRGLSPQGLVTAVARAAPPGARLTVDAGAHMIPAMAFWPAADAFDVLISNGLSTMGFALPAAIAAALAEPERRVVAMTGDGGLAMCLAELATAARLGLALVVVVFNDAALSLIEVKQRARDLPPSGVRYPACDFAAAARALGCRGYLVEDADALNAALAAAFADSGPALLDVRIDATGYRAQLRALRG